MLQLKLTALLSLCCFLMPNVFGEDWPYPDDIPEPMEASVGLAGQTPTEIVRYLMADGAASAKLSPDGEMVAYQWSVSGAPQLWVIDAELSYPRQLTFGQGITFYEWSPNSKELLVARDTAGNEKEGYYLITTDGTQEREILPPSGAFRSFGAFSTDGTQIIYSSTERNGTDFDVFKTAIHSHATELLLEGSFGFYTSAWQPNNGVILVSETVGEDGNNLFALNVEEKTLSSLFEPEISANFSDFAWLPDSSGFYLATNLDREFNALAFYSMASGEVSFVSEPQYDISNITLAGGGQFLIWTSNQDGYSVLHGINLATGKALATPELIPGVYSLSAAVTAAKVAVKISGPTSPGDVFVWDIANNTIANPVQSSLAGIDPATLQAPKSLRYPAQDGVELQGLLYEPVADKTVSKYPVVVVVHGGPTAQSRPGFRRVEQYFVNQGVAVFSVNVRGSTGFGKTYARLDNQEKRLDSVRDLVDTVAFLSTKEQLDTSRIAVMGGSYGGYMVNAVLGMYPGVFDAGISMVGVSDWVRALNEASPGLKASDRVEYGDIREQKWIDFYTQNSPIATAENINVPLLVMHGANDPRDPVTESDRLVEAVRSTGQQVRYMRFKDEGHSLKKRGNRVRFYTTVSSFLNEHLTPDLTELDD